MSKTILFIGRFQPLHLGHLKAIASCLNKNDYLIVAIGSSNKQLTSLNPFTKIQRKCMLEIGLFEILKLNRKKCKIVYLKDYDSDLLWTLQVMKLKFDFVVTSSNRTISCLKGKAEIIKPPLFNRKVYRATSIRKVMASNGKWNVLLNPKIYKYLKSINSQKIIEKSVKIKN